MLKAYITFLKVYPLYWGIFFTLVPLALLLRKWGHLYIAYKFLFFYLLWKFVSDQLMVCYAAAGQNNLYLYNLTVPMRYALLSGMVYHFYESTVFKRFLTTISPAFICFFLWDVYASNKEIGSLNQHLVTRYALMVECILMILWILLYFYEVLQSLRIKNLLRAPSFLISAAWLLFYASLVLVAPLMYYIYRWDGRLDLGSLLLIPDYTEMLSIMITALAVSFIHNNKL